jgi:hypothetical protein
LPYAALETSGGPPFQIKAIDVDMHLQQRGIGSAFFCALKFAGFIFKPSGRYTTAGATFLNKIDL